jgi:sugar diacid utilization regulator
MGLTISEALSISPLDRCTVLAGRNGLTREINSVNSFDAPDVMSWLKAGDFVLTSGYVFDNEFDFVSLIHDLANRNCSGLAIKISKLPQIMIKAADQLNFPIIVIPEDLSISDLLAPILRKVFVYQSQQNEQDKKNTFLKRLIQGEIKSEEAIFAEGGPLGLSLAKGYICLCINTFPFNSSIKPNFFSLENKIQSIVKKDDAHLFVGEYEQRVIMIVQKMKKHDISLLSTPSLNLKDELIHLLTHELSEEQLHIGIGGYQSNILQFPYSFQEADQAIQIGRLISPAQKVYDYSNAQIYTMLQHIPPNVSETFLKATIGPIIDYDKETNSNLVKTLEVYLDCSLSPSETGNRLGVHRNTIHFRIARIKELLNTSFDNGKVIFQLNFAIRLLHLMK